MLGGRSAGIASAFLGRGPFFCRFRFPSVLFVIQPCSTLPDSPRPIPNIYQTKDRVKKKREKFRGAGMRRD